MASYISISSGMVTNPMTITSTVASRQNPNTYRVPSNIMRVTKVDPTNGTICYEPFTRNIGKSYVGKCTRSNQAKLGSNTISSIPKIGEPVEIYSAPDENAAYNKSQTQSDLKVS